MDSELIHVCVVCGQRAIQRCQRCHGEWYCDAACQRLRWAQHKPECDTGTTNYQRGMTLERAWILGTFETEHRAKLRKILAEHSGDLVVRANLNIEEPATQRGEVSVDLKVTFEQYLDYCASKLKLYGNYFPGGKGMGKVADGMRAERYR
jgi:hypothetical protein